MAYFELPKLPTFFTDTDWLQVVKDGKQVVNTITKTLIPAGVAMGSTLEGNIAGPIIAGGIIYDNAGDITKSYEIVTSYGSKAYDAATNYWYGTDGTVPTTTATPGRPVVQDQVSGQTNRPSTGPVIFEDPKPTGFPDPSNNPYSITGAAAAGGYVTPGTPQTPQAQVIVQTPPVTTVEGQRVERAAVPPAIRRAVVASQQIDRLANGAGLPNTTNSALSQLYSVAVESEEPKLALAKKMPIMAANRMFSLHRSASTPGTSDLDGYQIIGRALGMAGLGTAIDISPALFTQLYLGFVRTLSLTTVTAYIYDSPREFTATTYCNFLKLEGDRLNIIASDICVGVPEMFLYTAIYLYVAMGNSIMTWCAYQSARDQVAETMAVVSSALSATNQLAGEYMLQLLVNEGVYGTDCNVPDPVYNNICGHGDMTIPAKREMHVFQYFLK